jgi:hypothetical protein
LKQSSFGHAHTSARQIRSCRSGVPHQQQTAWTAI